MRSAFLLAVVVAAGMALCSTSAVADSLYPKCSGPILDSKAPQTQPERVLSVIEGGKLMKGVRITCVAFEVKSMSTAGVCEVPHQTQYPFRLFLRATGTSSDNKPYTDEFDIRDTVGGSINRLTVSVPTASKFEVVFRNTAVNTDCMLNIRAIITTDELTDGAALAAPTIVTVDPQTAYQNTLTHFVVKHTSSHEGSKDLMFVVPLEAICTDTGFRTFLEKETDTELLKKYLTPYGSSTSNYDVWVSKNPGVDNYRVCHSSGDKDAAEVALLTIFKGNPSYFDVVTGDDTEGKIYIGVPVTIKFVGYDLDTRPNRDRAKLVDDSKSCDVGAPAGGVSVATDLGPADSYGPQTTFTTWAFTITKGGSYRVCYMRVGSSWSDVPSIDELPPGAAPTKAPAAAPIPTNPTSKKACILADHRADAPTYKTLLKLTLTTSTISSYFVSVLADALCVSDESLKFMPLPQDENAGPVVLFVDVYCEAAVCSSQDRKDYLLQIAKQGTDEYKTLGISAVEEVRNTGINGFTKDYLTDLDSKRKHGAFMTVIVCLTLVALSALGVYGWLQYRKNQHHFIQFGVGVEDEDLEIDEPPPRSAVDPKEEA